MHAQKSQTCWIYIQGFGGSPLTFLHIKCILCLTLGFSFSFMTLFSEFLRTQRIWWERNEFFLKVNVVSVFQSFISRTGQLHSSVSSRKNESTTWLFVSQIYLELKCPFRLHLASLDVTYIWFKANISISSKHDHYVLTAAYLIKMIANDCHAVARSYFQIKQKTMRHEQCKPCKIIAVIMRECAAY